MRKYIFVFVLICFMFCCFVSGAEISSQSYLLPGSDSRYLTDSDLAGMTPQVLRYARNEIFAKHGRIFNSAELSNYFNTMPWYSGTIPADAFDESVFNEYEKYNIDLISNREMGAYVLDQDGYSYEPVYSFLRNDQNTGVNPSTNAEIEYQTDEITVRRGKEIGLYREFLWPSQHEDENWTYNIEGFSLYDIDNDGLSELFTYGGGKMDYTKIFTIKDGIVSYVGWASGYSIYDNGYLTSDYLSGSGYTLHSIWRVLPETVLERLFMYAEWHTDGTYSAGESCTQDDHESVSWDIIQAQLDTYLGGAKKVILKKWENSIWDRIRVFEYSYPLDAREAEYFPAALENVFPSFKMEDIDGYGHLPATSIDFELQYEPTTRKIRTLFFELTIPESMGDPGIDWGRRGFNDNFGIVDKKKWDSGERLSVLSIQRYEDGVGAPMEYYVGEDGGFVYCVIPGDPTERISEVDIQAMRNSVILLADE